jgi:hypothetical protein
VGWSACLLLANFPFLCGMGAYTISLCIAFKTPIRSCCHVCQSGLPEWVAFHTMLAAAVYYCFLDCELGDKVGVVKGKDIVSS